LDIIVKKTYYDENILVLLKLFPWIRDKKQKAIYAELLVNLSSSKRLSKYIKWEINSTLAFYLKSISSFSKAIIYHRKVMKYELEEIGKISTEYADSVNFSGSIEIISGRYKEARKLFQKELKIREIISRDLSVDVFITRCFHSIALTFHYEGNYRKAIKNYEIALERRLKEGGRYCEATIGTLSNLGITFYEAGISLAERYLEDALRIGKLLKGNYSDSSTILPYLSRIKLEKGEVDAAENLLKINLDNREFVFGRSSREAAFSHADLMNFYIETGFFEKALEHAQEQNKLLVRVLSNNHEFSISSYKELGSVYYHLGMYKKAIDSFGIALFLSKKYFMHDLKFQHELKYNKGLCYFNLGDYRKARFLFMSCLRFERNGLLLNLIGLSLSQIKPALSIKYHLMALEEYKCEMSVYQLKEIEILNSVENNSFSQVKIFYLPKLKIKKMPNWLQKAYDL
jgi:tetratricopeptide (TPR) repeat protein